MSLAVIAGSSAATADGYRDKGFAPPPVYSWTGFYVGGQAGLLTGNTQGQGPAPPFTATDFNFDGGLYGGHVGYNYQTGRWVLGIEGTFSGSNAQGSTTCLLVLNCEREVNWIATAEGRLGYAFGHSLLYARGGAAWADLETRVSFLGLTALTGSATHSGWTAGFGFEQALGDGITVRAEYAHIDLGSEDHGLMTPGGFGPIPDPVDAEIDTIRIGASLKFGG